MEEWEISRWTVGAACATASAVTLLWWLKRGNAVKAEYYERVRRRLEMEQRRRALLREQLTVAGQLVTPERQDVLEMPLLQLLEQLRAGKLTATDAVRAYQAKALEVTELYNCVTEFVMDAQERAAALDALPEASRGPLHGMPFSVKDSINIEGYDSTMGLAKFVDDRAAATAPLVQTLIDLGGIPFCKSNIPQTMLSFGCSNPVWGVTRNIYAADRVPGGSSGGEGVLVAAGASPLGIGSDIGGSARNPALFSGGVGFKPTYGRVSSKGMRSTMPATIGIRATIGFMTRESAGARRVMELLTSPLPTADMYRLDPLTPRVRWNPESAAGKRRWRIGYITELPLVPVTPGVKRAVTETVQALEAAGHDLVPFQLDVTADTLRTYLQIILPDNGAHLLRAVEDEELDPVIEGLVSSMRLPRWLRSLIAWGTSKHFRYLPSQLRARTESTLEAIGVRLAADRCTERVLRDWRRLELDLLLLPGFACPAPPRHAIGSIVVGGFYTAIFNMMNFPAGTLTASHETAADQTALDKYPETHVELRWIKEATRGAVGQPLGVQVVALPWREEELLAGMEDIERIITK